MNLLLSRSPRPALFRESFSAHQTWTRQIRRLLPLAGLALAPMAGAHPGHGLLEAGPAHLFASPYHLALLGSLGFAFIAAARLVHRRAAKRMLQILGLAFLAATVAFGFH